MDAEQPPDTDLERELETWDWVRTAGICADELRRALLAPQPAPELRPAA